MNTLIESDAVELVGVPGSRRTEPVWFQRSDGTTYCAGDGIPESGQHVVIAPVLPTAKDEALAAIALLELEQSRKLTPRALRELFMGILSVSGQAGGKPFGDLKAIDDRIKLERAKL